LGKSNNFQVIVIKNKTESLHLCLSHSSKNKQNCTFFHLGEEIILESKTLTKREEIYFCLFNAIQKFKDITGLKIYLEEEGLSKKKHDIDKAPIILKNDHTFDKFLNYVKNINYISADLSRLAIIEQSVQNFYSLYQGRFQETNTENELTEKMIVKHFLELANKYKWEKSFSNLILWAEAKSSANSDVSNLSLTAYIYRKDLQTAFKLGEKSFEQDIELWRKKYAKKEFGSLIYNGMQKSMKANSEVKYSLIGFFNYNIGLGESARNIATVFRKKNIPVETISLYHQSQVAEESITGKSENEETKTQIFVVNGNHMKRTFEELNWPSKTKNYRIGIWAWETEVLPPNYALGIEYVNEVWAVSNYVKNAVEKITTKTIRVFPNVIDTDKLNQIAEEVKQECENEIQGYFFYAFDYLSDFYRKNPISLIISYVNAFPNPKKSPGLLIKTQNHSLDLRNHKILMDLVINREDIQVINQNWNKKQLIKRIYNSRAVVSPHASEGFGLLMAESMALGKLTIATGYSGNLEFMNENNSILVNYRLRKIKTEKDSPYHGSKGNWAYIDEDDLTDKLRVAENDSINLKNLAKSGKKMIETKFSINVVDFPLT
jgi:glycosyltransferase involved in cell wall biosynthesis